MFNNQELLQLVIISFILVTLMCDSRMILLGEIRCKSLLGVNGLRDIKRSKLKMKLVDGVLVINILSNLNNFFLLKTVIIRIFTTSTVNVR